MNIIASPAPTSARGLATGMKVATARMRLSGRHRQRACGDQGNARRTGRAAGGHLQRGVDELQHHEARQSGRGGIESLRGVEPRHSERGAVQHADVYTTSATDPQFQTLSRTRPTALLRPRMSMVRDVAREGDAVQADSPHRSASGERAAGAAGRR